MEIGRYIKLMLRDNSYFMVDAKDEGQIDAAVLEFLESDGAKEKLLDLELVGAGGGLRLLAGEIQCWFISTPEGRERTIEFEAALRAEEAANRMVHGLPPE